MIYLDHAATTPPSKAAKAAALRSFNMFGNPSSLHVLGIEAEKEIAHARDVLARIIGASPPRLIFASGGTEANNLALKGTARKHKGRRIITTRMEHSSILETLAVMADFEPLYLDTDEGGAICLDALQKALEEPTCLVSIHHVNSATGVIQDIHAIGNIIKRVSPTTLFHVDAAQSFCKLPIHVNNMQVDLLTASAHKVGGLKGCGFLFIRDGVHCAPTTQGGGQERGLRSGTENVAGILSFAAAAESFMPITAPLKQVFLDALNLDDVKVLGKNTSPYILNIDVAGVNPEVLLNALSQRGVCVSAGAACSANKKGQGQIGWGQAPTLRVSFGEGNTVDEVVKAAELLTEIATNLRKLRKL
ncbi:MAG: cysteine desulfurase [Defluviitaleaceae bacterium]|nr:cysteine desulfurase [Defluviitaleaceae bacterium]